MNENMISCPRCGSLMKSNARYCMKCGALNYDHPDNQSMKQYISENEVNKSNEKYTENENNTLNKVYVGGKELKEISINTPQVESKNYKAGILYVLIISLLIFGGIYFFLDKPFSLGLSVSISVFIILVSLLASSNIYRKAGYSFFTPYIPIYSMYVLCEMVFDKGILCLLSFVPIVNIIFLIVIIYKLGEKYGINGIVSVLFAPIVMLIIAFSDSVVFKGNINFKSKTLVNIVGFIFMLLCALLIVIPFINIIKT